MNLSQTPDGSPCSGLRGWLPLVEDLDQKTPPDLKEGFVMGPPDIPDDSIGQMDAARRTSQQVT
jgi:hypothetical protein